MDAVTPTGLPQEPISHEEGKSICTPNSTASSGSPVVDVGAVFACFVFLSYVGFLTYWVFRGARLVRYNDDYLFLGPLCGRTAGRELSSRCPLGTSSSLQTLGGMVCHFSEEASRACSHFPQHIVELA